MLDKLYFQRCFDLAQLGNRHARPNPKVGSVIVYENRIIGEGYHMVKGSHHAEVNAVNNVKAEDKHLIDKSTIYVSLEPCHHYGSTPPCVDLIIKMNIPKIRIALPDPTEKVYLKSIEKLKENNRDIIVFEKNIDALSLISEFEAVHIHKRPFIQIKMAKSADNIIGLDDAQVHLTNKFTNVYTHKLRAYTDAILVGTNTALIDNPSLNLRNYPGKSPLRIVLDREGKLPSSHKLLSDGQITIIVTQKEAYPIKTNKSIILLDFGAEDFLDRLCSKLLSLNINHLMIEGGATLIKSFLKRKIWDEAVIVNTNHTLTKGTKAPNINGLLKSVLDIDGDQVRIIKNIKV